MTSATTEAIAAPIRARFTGAHPGQVAVMRSPARFRVLCTGRRWGKTRLAVMEAILEALRGGRVWWVAPSYPLAQVGWRELRHHCRKVTGASVSLSDMRYDFPGGGWLQVKSAGGTGGLRGEGLDFIVFDECAQAREDVWTEELRPSLSDRKGRVLFISTPLGLNWFHGLFLRGEDGGEWESWHFTSYDNPHLDGAEIDQARDDMPEAIFRQEYLAEFVDSGDTVFAAADVEALGRGWTGLAEPGRSRRYLTAWDIGRRKDPAVGITVDFTAEPYQVVAFERLVGVPYPEQQACIEARAHGYDFRPVIESNGPGDPVIENLNVPARPFVTTARSKVDAITALQLLLERGALKSGIPEIRRELLAYRWADKGIMQDCVMALAIAALHLPPPGRPRGADEGTPAHEPANATILGGIDDLEF